MKVKCIALKDPSDGSPTESSPWLTVGREYAVASITATSNGRLELHVLTDAHDGLGWFDADLFTTVDPAIPASWIANLNEQGSLELGPATWLEPGLWEAYYDGDAAALRTVQDEVDLLREIG